MPLALVASPAQAARAAERMLRKRYDFVPLEEAAMVVALGGDGFLLQTLHEMLHREKLCPVFGMNRGTVGFLMNDWRIDRLRERLAGAKTFSVPPLSMRATSATRCSPCTWVTVLDGPAASLCLATTR